MKAIKSPSLYRSAFPTQAVIVASVCLAALCPTALGASGVEKPNPQTPNILWLIAEDFGQHLGCYGTKEVWTPNLDGLADNTVVIFFGDNRQAHVRGKQFCYKEGLLVPLLVRWPKNFAVPVRFKAGTGAG